MCSRDFHRRCSPPFVMTFRATFAPRHEVPPHVRVEVLQPSKLLGSLKSTMWGTGEEVRSWIDLGIDDANEWLKQKPFSFVDCFGLRGRSFMPVRLVVRSPPKMVLNPPQRRNDPVSLRIHMTRCRVSLHPRESSPFDGGKMKMKRIQMYLAVGIVATGSAIRSDGGHIELCLCGADDYGSDAYRHWNNFW